MFAVLFDWDVLVIRGVLTILSTIVLSVVVDPIVETKPCFLDLNDNCLLERKLLFLSSTARFWMRVSSIYINSLHLCR